METQNSRNMQKQIDTNLPFDKYRSNIYSQNGEDGVIAEILKRLNLFSAKNWCVEFGAWDGKHLSNTFALVEQNNFNAIYIEGDERKYRDLLDTAHSYPRIIPILAYVDRQSSDEKSLDRGATNTNSERV